MVAGKKCGFRNESHKECTNNCIYYETCARNPYRYSNDIANQIIQISRKEGGNDGKR